MLSPFAPQPAASDRGSRRLPDRQHHMLAAVHRLKFLGVVFNANAVATASRSSMRLNLPIPRVACDRLCDASSVFAVFLPTPVADGTAFPVPTVRLVARRWDGTDSRPHRVNTRLLADSSLDFDYFRRSIPIMIQLHGQDRIPLEYFSPSRNAGHADRQPRSA